MRVKNYWKMRRVIIRDLITHQFTEPIELNDKELDLCIQSARSFLRLHFSEHNTNDVVAGAWYYANVMLCQVRSVWPMWQTEETMNNLLQANEALSKWQNHYLLKR